MQHQKKAGSTLPNFQNIQKPANTQWSLHYRQKKGLEKEINIKYANAI